MVLNVPLTLNSLNPAQVLKYLRVFVTKMIKSNKEKKIIGKEKIPWIQDRIWLRIENKQHKGDGERKAILLNSVFPNTLPI